MSDITSDLSSPRDQTTVVIINGRDFRPIVPITIATTRGHLIELCRNMRFNTDTKYQQTIYLKTRRFLSSPGANVEHAQSMARHSNDTRQWLMIREAIITLAVTRLMVFNLAIPIWIRRDITLPPPPPAEI